MAETPDQSERCPAVHPTLGLQCERMAKDCIATEADHTAKREDGTDVLWPNRHGTTPMDKFFVDWRKMICPLCSGPLDFQFKLPVVWWCAICQKWFDGELKRL